MTDWNPGPTWLFCPVDRPERYGKALAAADVVILDVEDAVAPTAKEHAGAIAAAPRVDAVMFGADDLVASMGDIARYSRSRALVATKAYDRLAVDAMHMNIPDVEGLASACEDAVAVGFDAMVAIHPSRGVTTFRGRMVAGPIYKQAERLVHRAALTHTTPTRTAPTGVLTRG